MVNTIGSDIRIMVDQHIGVYYGYVCDGIFQTSQNLVNAFRTDANGCYHFFFRKNADGPF